MFIRGATCHGEIFAGVLGILVLRPVAHVSVSAGLPEGFISHENTCT